MGSENAAPKRRLRSCVTGGMHQYCAPQHTRRRACVERMYTSVVFMTQSHDSSLLFYQWKQSGSSASRAAQNSKS